MRKSVQALTPACAAPRASSTSAQARLASAPAGKPPFPIKGRAFAFIASTLASAEATSFWSSSKRLETSSSCSLCLLSCSALCSAASRSRSVVCCTAISTSSAILAWFAPHLVPSRATIWSSSARVAAKLESSAARTRWMTLRILSMAACSCLRRSSSWRCRSTSFCLRSASSLRLRSCSSRRRSASSLRWRSSSKRLRCASSSCRLRSSSRLRASSWRACASWCCRIISACCCCMRLASASTCCCCCCWCCICSWRCLSSSACWRRHSAL
mmetsp:Transcript_75133/g.207247  ORF Transcript_75133/g.207247 Transcript_75133/m.207247 type:complete len:271 (+) Transcript_75133:1764-2576(+)